VVLARFKDLCADAGDVDGLASFWSLALGLRPADPASGRLDPPPGRPDEERLWVNPVPEPRVVKTRVHLDLRLTGADRLALLAAGATVLADPTPQTPWQVLGDPEGNAFCVFAVPGGSPAPEPRAFELVVDCRDPEAQAAWWAEATGGRVGTSETEPWAWVEGAAGFPWEDWVFAPVPEPKTAKNRWHWDVTLASPDPAGLVAHGATLLREPAEGSDWWVLADLEGNEFCAFAPEGRA